MRRLATSRYHVPPLVGLPRAAVPLAAQFLSGQRTSQRQQSSCAATAATSTYTPLPLNHDHRYANWNVRRGPALDGRAKYIDVALKVYFNIAKDNQGSDCFQTAMRLATEKDDSLAVVTAQMILYMSSSLDQNIHRRLPQGDLWEQRLSKVTAQGFKSNELFYWVEILLARTSEERAQLFLSSKERMPLFLLNYILRNDNLETTGYMSPETLHRIVHYCMENLQGDLHGSRGSEPKDANIRAATMNPEASTVTLRRLLQLARLIEPQIIPLVGQLAVQSLKVLADAPRVHGHDEDAMYRFSCTIFNSVLYYLAIPTPTNQYSNRHLNWKGILELLRYSSSLKRSLVINRRSYREIRSILLGVAKVSHERDTASTLQQTWPPYRILRNGIEEGLSVDEFNSRVLKAGAMMVESGYTKLNQDLVLDVLGGKAPDGTPTIQTRSVAPTNRGSISDVWAAQVRATRNAEEAWQVFLHPPEPGLEPTPAVCEQVLFKLISRAVDELHNNLPGDGRETFPFPDLNYSDVSKARFTPPSLSEFTSTMHKSGIPLRAKSLSAIISCAPTSEHALEYVDRSDLTPAQKAYLKSIISVHGTTTHVTTESSSAGQHTLLPVGLAFAVINLLCRSQRSTSERGPSTHPALQIRQIRKAHLLAREYRAAEATGLWIPILEALARRGMFLGGRSQQRNALLVLAMAGDILADVEKSVKRASSRSKTHGLTLSLLKPFCGTLSQALKTMLPHLTDAARAMDGAETESQSPVLLAFLGHKPHPESSGTSDIFTDWPSAIEGLDFEKMVPAAQRALKSMWRRAATYEAVDRTVVRANAAAVNNYMRALAFLGDHDEMASLLDWTLKHINEITENGEGKIVDKTSYYLGLTLCHFRVFAEPLLDAKVVDALRLQVEALANKDHMSVQLRWPSPAGLSMFLQYDKHGHRRKLLELVEIAKEYRSRDRGGGDGGAHNVAAESVVEEDVAWWQEERLQGHIRRMKSSLAKGHSSPRLALHEGMST